MTCRGEGTRPGSWVIDLFYCDELFPDGIARYPNTYRTWDDPCVVLMCHGREQDDGTGTGEIEIVTWFLTAYDICSRVTMWSLQRMNYAELQFADTDKKAILGQKTRPVILWRKFPDGTVKASGTGQTALRKLFPKKRGAERPPADQKAMDAINDAAKAMAEAGLPKVETEGTAILTLDITAKRSDRWTSDASIPAYYVADASNGKDQAPGNDIAYDYENNARGHLPSLDPFFLSPQSVQNGGSAMETSIWTNCVSQHAKTNCGEWKDMEVLFTKHCKRNDESRTLYNGWYTTLTVTYFGPHPIWSNPAVLPAATYSKWQPKMIVDRVGKSSVRPDFIAKCIVGPTGDTTCAWHQNAVENPVKINAAGKQTLVTLGNKVTMPVRYKMLFDVEQSFLTLRGWIKRRQMPLIGQPSRTTIAVSTLIRIDQLRARISDQARRIGTLMGASPVCTLALTDLPSKVQDVFGDGDDDAEFSADILNLWEGISDSKNQVGGEHVIDDNDQEAATNLADDWTSQLPKSVNELSTAIAKTSGCSVDIQKEVAQLQQRTNVMIQYLAQLKNVVVNTKKSKTSNPSFSSSSSSSSSCSSTSSSDCTVSSSSSSGVPCTFGGDQLPCGQLFSKVVVIKSYPNALQPDELFLLTKTAHEKKKASSPLVSTPLLPCLLSSPSIPCVSSPSAAVTPVPSPVKPSNAASSKATLPGTTMDVLATDDSSSRPQLFAPAVTQDLQVQNPNGQDVSGVGGKRVRKPVTRFGT